MRALFLYISIFIIFCISCTSSIESEISMMINQKFQYDKNYIEKYKSRFQSSIDPIGDYTLVSYYDSIECMACHANKLNSWNDWISSFNAFGIKVFIIFSPKHKEIDNLKLLIQRQRLPFDVYIDTIGIIRKANPWIPDNPICHTFLMDKDNNIILVGDPRKHPKIKDLILKIVENKPERES